ncbi:predicted protein [Sclerotinia sclerotiorum 1980 UF-70]|uniref:Uncharacterized protein n=1 Tax=Sclerotinia sclerotiorum (strain ATCC 18683 / 1980 / Ss-1) TaxID=665079 RepID=A7EA05_SCLS1|nr:predicted protein [Sclerotinia sclerotiorum 1980 UF-70]EDN99283.1 predicted protein [Sclerotinia sclerotiorum 1980 UF-70]
MDITSKIYVNTSQHARNPHVEIPDCHLMYGSIMMYLMSCALMLDVRGTEEGLVVGRGGQYVMGYGLLTFFFVLREVLSGKRWTVREGVRSSESENKRSCLGFAGMMERVEQGCDER